jgi:NADPH:quinone reductase-like Zn-dependent oxidoreductase
LLDALYWKRLPEEELGPEEVRVEVRAVGLNFKDVLVAIGLVAEPVKIARGMGYDCSGVVTAVGPNVTKHRIGDRVVVCESGTFATSLNVSQLLCAGMPDDMSFEEGATMPLVFATASYCLLDAVSLTKGMSVLIHAAAGGVGLAAIQLCKMVGADIYCTVGSEDKVRHLMEHCDIPRDHIFNSRDTSFLPGLVAMTDAAPMWSSIRCRASCCTRHGSVSPKVAPLSRSAGATLSGRLSWPWSHSRPTGLLSALTWVL